AGVDLLGRHLGAAFHPDPVGSPGSGERQDGADLDRVALSERRKRACGKDGREQNGQELAHLRSPPPRVIQRRGPYAAWSIGFGRGEVNTAGDFTPPRWRAACLHLSWLIVRPPYRIIMGGYSPPTTGFSCALTRIGDRLQAKFGKDVDVKYVYNILSLGYKAEDILWLVESGVLALGYQSSSYFTERVPDLGIADLPFLFADGAKARDAMDGRFGQTLTKRIEAKMDFRILG